MKKQTVIIGGGVIGLACAHYLAREGVGVTILERDKIGQGASHGNCGLLCFSDVIPLCSPGTVTHEIVRTLKGTSPLYIKPDLDMNRFFWLLKFALKCRKSHMTRAANQKYELLKYSTDLFDQLMTDERIACDFETKGHLTVFKTKENFEKYEKTNAFLESYQLGARKIDIDELNDLEPALRTDLAGGWLNPADWHLRPDTLMSSWQDSLRLNGVVIEEDNPVLDFETHGRTVTAVETARGKVEADTVIIATGAWAPEIMNRLDLNVPVQPGKGYSITMERPDICPTHPCSLYEKSMVATPWKSGYRLGGTMEFSGYNDVLNPKRLDRLVSGAKAYLKVPMGQPVIEQWAGLRPMSTDDMPIIGPVPSKENLLIATGHGMLGLTLATGTGRIISDMVLGKAPEINVAPFSLSRFS